MDYFDKKIKSVFNQENNRVPEDFSWDNIKHGINNKLESSEKILILPKKNSSKWTLPFLIFGIGSILFLSWWFLIHSSQNGEQKPSEVENFAFEKNVRTEKTTSITQPDAGSISGEEATKKTSDSISIKQFSVSPTNGKVPVLSKIRETEQKDQSTLLVDGTDLIRNDNSNPEEKVPTHKLRVEVIQNILVPDQMAVISGTPGNGDLPHFVSIPALIKPRLLVVRVPDRVKPQEVHELVLPRLCGRQSPNWNIGLLAGTNIFSGNYKGDLAVSALRNPNTSIILGQSYTLSIDRYLTNHMLLSVRAGGSNSYSKLDLFYDKAITVLIKNALVQVDTNVITGRKTMYRKDTLLGAVERRHIIHYNRLRTLHTSLLLGNEWHFHPKWNISGSFGIQYSRILFSEGRTVGMDYAILDYTGSNPIFKEDHWALQGEISIFYRLNDSFSIGSHTFISQFIDNWTTETGLIFRPAIVSVQFGVNYSF